MAELVASLAVELQGFGLNKPEAAKFSKTLVESFGAGSWADVTLMPTSEFDQAVLEAKLLSVSIKKLKDVRHLRSRIFLSFIFMIAFQCGLYLIIGYGKFRAHGVPS